MIPTRVIIHTLFFLLISTSCFGLELRLRDQAVSLPT